MVDKYFQNALSVEVAEAAVCKVGKLPTAFSTEYLLAIVIQVISELSRRIPGNFITRTSWHQVMDFMNLGKESSTVVGNMRIHV
jgi:hypothetical protein